MSKILALDLGDKHVGVALSDALRFFAQPYDTIAAENLSQFLTKIITAEQLSTIVIGYPKTLKNTESQQTLKIKQLYEQLVVQFPQIQFVLWDERLTSQAAAKYVNSRDKADRLRAHAIAAAIILDTYLAHLRFITET
ncbi:MAG TPA: Holliday junction resolvase RuvX [Candidatus Babeliales bacterium]|nr:Holliday junction resolvase RuvX [Candidatus Babeliales bacterium]